ncbi:unnamed protein product [Chironomus riparius]|uniref:DUF4780 domain-containing protein n=1 Tax=Chironomus riparius TaxID=315576 RepID=A0A9N9WVU8_9DIPT|nr:unnamed protein product [Chironomus riparius]
MTESAFIDLDISVDEQKEICEEMRPEGNGNNQDPEVYNLRHTFVRKKPSGAEIRRAKSLKQSEDDLNGRTKRQRDSPETSENSKMTKRPKEDKKSFRDVLQSIEVIIKPVDYPETIIDENGVVALERHLLKKIDMLKVGESAPQFHQRKLIDGHWRIKCIGQHSKEWLIKVIQFVRLKGSFLELMDVADMAQRPKCRVFVPGECSVDSLIMHRFKVQNPDFDLRSWRILSNKRQFNNEGRHIMVEMAEESVEALKSKNWYLAYGLTQVKFHLVVVGTGGKNAKTDSNSNTTTSEAIEVMDCLSEVEDKVDDI